MQGKVSRTGRFFYNSLLMVGVTLLMRAIGVGFNAYVAGKAGAQAMGLYSLLSGVYGFAVTLACSGIHLGTTRTVADALGKGDRALARKYASRALGISLFFGTLAGALLFFGAPIAGAQWLKDARTVLDADAQICYNKRINHGRCGMTYELCNIGDYTEAQYGAMYRAAAPDRQTRADKFKHEDDRKRCLCADMLARKMLAKAANVAPEYISFTYGDKGKPRANLPLHFNVSHAGAYVLCAVANTPIGADIEQIKPFRAGMVARYFTAAEAAYIWGNNPEEWEIKEDEKN